MPPTGADAGTVLRSIVDGLLQRLGRVRPRVRMRPGILKLNIGGALEVAEGWVNVDGSIHTFVAGAPPPILSLVYRRTKNVSQMMTDEEYVRRLRRYKQVFCDFSRGLPFESDSVDYVFCSHVLEHFEPDGAARLVRDTLRVLKPGGWARFCVPDLAHAVRRYQQGAKQEALRYFFTGELGRFDQHRYMYDNELLSSLLQEQGFSEVAEREYRKGSVPDLDVLDNRPEETLYVEGRKPINQTRSPAEFPYEVPFADVMPSRI